MKTRYPFHVMKMDNVYVTVSIGSGARRFNGYLRMDETTAFVVKMLQEDVTQEQLVEALKEKYPDNTDLEIRDGVKAILSNLEDEDLLIR